MNATRPAEADPDAANADGITDGRQAREEAFRRWRDHLARCKPTRPPLPPFTWGRHYFEEAER